MATANDDAHCAQNDMFAYVHLHRFEPVNIFHFIQIFMKCKNGFHFIVDDSLGYKSENTVIPIYGTFRFHRIVRLNCPQLEQSHF